MNLGKLFRMSVIIVITAFTVYSVSAQKQTVGAPKTKLVNQFVELTMQWFPTGQIQKEFDAIMEEQKKSLGESIAAEALAKFDKSPDLNNVQKENLKTNLPKLSEKINDKMAGILKKDFKPDNWVRESLRTNLTKDFTINELQQLVNLFSSEGGQTMISFFKNGFENNKDLGDLKNLDEKSADKLRKFFNSPLSHKFSEKLLAQVETDLKNKTDLWGKKIEKELTVDSFAPIIIGYITEYGKAK